MHAHHDLSERMSLDRVKREANHSYRGPPRKVELFNARKFVHACDVNLVSVCVPQCVQVLHELIVIFGNQYPPTPILPRNVGDHKVRIPSSLSFRARRPDRGIPNSTPQGRLQARRRVQRRFGVPAVSVLQAESRLYSINTEGMNIGMTSLFILV